MGALAGEAGKASENGQGRNALRRGLRGGQKRYVGSNGKSGRDRKQWLKRRVLTFDVGFDGGLPVHQFRDAGSEGRNTGSGRINCGLCSVSLCRERTGAGAVLTGLCFSLRGGELFCVQLCGLVSLSFFQSTTRGLSSGERFLSIAGMDRSRFLRRFRRLMDMP
ncbi:hypothetical protein AA103587_0707 [Gluconobacter kanchanaburiensis NBRC 103587]|nr:hypothetical protein AA103587_0707 [Gluconobacter kanchanaburiensis NBRC 103587]